MNRRGFLRLLAAIPLVRHIPLPKSLYGSGSDGDLVLTDNKMISPYKWINYGGGGGGGAGGYIVVIKVTNITVTARGGSGSEKTMENP